MIAKNKSEYINYRFKRAQESFDDALIMIDNKKWNTAINRLYYSSFYAVIALLLKKDIETRSHNGARTKFSDEFIKTGLIDKRLGKLFSNSQTIDKNVTTETSTISMTRLYYHLLIK